MSIDGQYRYTTFLVQGWKEDGKWRRRLFKVRAEAEAFIAAKQLKDVTDAQTIRPVVTTLPPEQVREAESAVAILAGVGAPATLTDAARHYAAHLRATVAVESIPFRGCAQGLPGRQGGPRRASSAKCYPTGKLAAALERDKPLSTSRRWHSLNPTAGIAPKRTESRAPEVLSVEQGTALMRHVEGFRGGALVPYFALALFAGIRPGPQNET